MAQVELDEDCCRLLGLRKQGGFLYSVPSRGPWLLGLWAGHSATPVRSLPHEQFGQSYFHFLVCLGLSGIGLSQSNLLGFGKEGSRTNILTV